MKPFFADLTRLRGEESGVFSAANLYVAVVPDIEDLGEIRYKKIIELNENGRYNLRITGIGDLEDQREYDITRGQVLNYVQRNRNIDPFRGAFVHILNNGDGIWHH
jgi:predicted RNA-binding protein with RPS1 domain